MSLAVQRLPLALFALATAYLTVTALQSGRPVTIAIVLASILMFATSWASAARLLGPLAALRFVGIAMALGWFSEQMGATHGWFFGQYHYTPVLGARLGAVPLVIPMMWFSLSYAGYVIANLIVWQSPVDGRPGWRQAVVLSFLAAMVVTAFDLGADPYLIRVVGAWVMVKADGWWFGETLQGFFGWMIVGFSIIVGFRWSVRRAPPRPAGPAGLQRAVLVPLVIYASGMVFQIFLGDPPETRAIAPFAMGIPLLCALAGFQRWRATPPEHAA